MRREPSGPWGVTADRARGTIDAEARGRPEGGGGCPLHRRPVVLTDTATPLRTVATFRSTGRVAGLVTEIAARLGAKDKRLPASGR